MNIALPILRNRVLGLGLLAVSAAMMPAGANAQQFVASGQSLNLYIMDTNGAASLYDLTIGINRLNVISVSASSKRYDIAATGNSVTNPAGTAVLRSTNTNLLSRVGTPVITNIYEYVSSRVTGDPFNPMNPSNPVTYVTNYITNKTTNLVAPFAIFLNDGGRVKGTVTRTVSYDGFYTNLAYTNFYFEGGATHQGKIGFGGTDYDTYMGPSPMPMN